MTCPDCKGKGWRLLTEEEMRLFHIVTATKTICPKCQGGGEVESQYKNYGASQKEGV